MMDFSSFAEETFNVKNWVNAALQTGRADEPTDAHASMVVMKLQLFSLELNNLLEETSSQALLTIPRAIREIEKVRRESTALKQKMSQFQDRLSKMEGNTEQSIHLLATLDKVKEKMETCTRALKEADKLSVFNAQIESVFATNDFVKIATIISDLKDSLDVVGDVPEFKDQARQLARHQDRLEGLLRPQLLSAFNRHDEEATIGLRDVFMLIDRITQFQQHYVSCRLVPVRQAWENYTPDVPFMTWLPSFYDQLQSLLSSEALWAQKIFPSPHQYYAVVAQLLTTALNSFSQSFQTRIESTLYPSPTHTLFTQQNPPTASPPAQHAHTLAYANSPTFVRTGDVAGVAKPGVLKLQDLITIYLITVHFADSVSALIADPKHYVDILQSIFGPLRPYQKKYPALEKLLLMSSLNSIKPVSGSYTDTVRNVGDSGNKIFLVAESAVERCMKFTHAVECEGLVAVLSEVFMDYLQHLLSIVQYLRTKAKLDDDLSTAPSSVYADSHAHDVAHFEGSMRLLQSAHLMAQRLTSFDRTLRSNLLEMKQSLFPGEANIGNQQLRNDPARLKKLLHFFQTLTDDVSYKLFPTAHLSMTTFSTAAQTLVFDIMFAFVKERLATLPHLEEWRAQAGGGMAGIEFTAYQHPLGYITRIGDHLLTTLPQQLEPYADSLARPVPEVRAPHSSPHIARSPTTTHNKLPQQQQHPIKSVKSESDLTHLDYVQEDSHVRDDNISGDDRTLLHVSGDSIKKDDQLGSSIDEADEGTVAHQWIAAVARGTMSLYVQQILEIPVLSANGAKQLHTDIAYLCNVLSALDVTTDPLLQKVFKFLSATKEEYAALADAEGPGSRTIATAIAHMRGFKI